MERTVGSQDDLTRFTQRCFTPRTCYAHACYVVLLTPQVGVEPHPSHDTMGPAFELCFPSRNPMTATSVSPAESIVGLSVLREYCLQLAQQAQAASFELAVLPGAVKHRWLQRSAQLLRERSAELVTENERDLAAAPGYGLTAAAIDRLRLTPKRLEEMA